MCAIGSGRLGVLGMEAREAGSERAGKGRVLYCLYCAEYCTVLYVLYWIGCYERQDGKAIWSRGPNSDAAVISPLICAG